MRSFDASTRTDLPIPYEGLTDLVGHLEQRCTGLVIVGAIARDLMACAAGDLPITRATRDIDLGVALHTAAVPMHGSADSTRPHDPWMPLKPPHRRRRSPPHHEGAGGFRLRP